jgi:hypothetical protein
MRDITGLSDIRKQHGKAAACMRALEAAGQTIGPTDLFIRRTGACPLRPRPEAENGLNQ